VRTSDHEFFEMPGVWERFKLTPEVREKLRVLRSMIPEGTRRILDLGCGNGVITNPLADEYEIVGVDWSQTALESVKAPRIRSSSATLPIRPRSFDLLLTSELLEHLPEDDFQSTIGEILHLEIPYLLITVPNDENLHVNEVKCPRCGHVFNASHHHRSLSVDSLIAHLPGYEVVSSRIGGPPVRAYPIPLLRLRQRVGGRWYQVPEGRTTLCSLCRNTHFPRVRYNPVSFFCDGVNKVISRRRPYWLYALLRRR
jgi:SAM-dependent methyltransferase